MPLFPIAFPFPLCIALLLACVAWKLLPSWIKTKHLDADDGRYIYQILGNIYDIDPSLKKKLKECADHLSRQTKTINKDERRLWIRMFLSYIVAILHRALFSSRLSHDELDKILTDGALADSVPKSTVESLLEQAKFAKWSYPFDPNHSNLEGCLREQGYLLLEHNTIAAPGRVVYYIAVHPTEHIMLVVPRGSSAVSDIITDAVGNLVDQSLEHDDPRLSTIYSHEGILMAANRLVKDITPTVDCFVNKEGYKLHLVGHSLGASVACVAGTILRAQIRALDDPSRFHIWSYASPPCLNIEASNAMKPFLSSMVWNEDVIPTLGIPNYVFTCQIMAHMDEMQREEHGIYHIPRALFVAAMTALGFNRWALQGKKQVELMNRALANARALHTERQIKAAANDLCVPGNVVYLWERRNMRQPTGEVNGVIAPGNKLLHLQVVIPTKNSLKDHFLDQYEKGMEQLLEQMGEKKEHRRSIFHWEPLTP